MVLNIIKQYKQDVKRFVIKIVVSEAAKRHIMVTRIQWYWCWVNITLRWYGDVENKFLVCKETIGFIKWVPQFTLTANTWNLSFLIFHRGNSTYINSFDQTKFLHWHVWYVYIWPRSNSRSKWKDFNIFHSQLLLSFCLATLLVMETKEAEDTSGLK